VGLAVDQLDPVKRFLRTTPLTFPVVMAGAQGIALSRAFGNQSGALPFSLVLGASGKLLQRKLGQLTAEDLRAWTRLN
jgi:hypothetical protein